MINDIIKNSIRFVLLILLQVLIVQHMRLGSYIILLPYVLFVLMLPFEFNKLTVLLLAFLTGLTIDMFYDTAGIHAAACSLIGYLRFYVLKIVAPREGYEVGLTPTVSSLGNLWFLTYAGIIIFIHHFIFFYLEIFRFDEFFTTLFRVILSSIGTFIFVYVIQFLFYKSSSQNN